MSRALVDRLGGWVPWACGAALVGEGLVVRALVGGSSVQALAWHLAACLLVASVAGAGRSGWRQRGHRRLVALSLCACLPGAGVVGVCCVILPAWRWRSRLQASPIVESEPFESRDVCRESAELAELLLASRALPIEQGMRRLRALRFLPLAAALPHWRAALRESSDELRLLAHALIAQCEARRQAVIERASAALDTAPSQTERWSASRVLAFAHWELACRERSCTEALHHALETVSRSAQAALAIHPEPQLYLLLARVCLRQADGDGALHWLQRAGCLGVSSASVALLHARAAFLQRRFEQVPHWLRQVSAHELREPRLARVQAFWSIEARNRRESEPSSEQ